MLDVKNYINRFISGVSPRGLLRLSQSEPEIKLPLQNLPIHSQDYHDYTIAEHQTYEDTDLHTSEREYAGFPKSMVSGIKGQILRY